MLDQIQPYQQRPVLGGRNHRHQPLLSQDPAQEYAVALNLSQSGPDPDPILNTQYGCGSEVNLDGYCDPEVDGLIEQQSREGNPQRRKALCGQWSAGWSRMAPAQ